MASTTPRAGLQTSTIVVATIGTLTTAALAYAVYFDYRRRSDVNFRRSLKKQQKQLHKAAKEEAVAAEKDQKERIRRVVDDANDEGFPQDPEKTEEYFMTEVARGEQMSQDGVFECFDSSLLSSSLSYNTDVHQALIPSIPHFASTRPSKSTLSQGNSSPSTTRLSPR